MNRLRTMAVVLITICAGPAFSQAWIDYYSSIDDFRIHTPGEFEVSEIFYPSEYGVELPARVYSYESGGDYYSVTVVDYTLSERLHEERARNEAEYLLYWEIDIRASVAYAATNFRQRGGEITYDAYHYIDRVEGHQLQITNEDSSRTYAAMYLHDSRLYIVEATVEPGSLPPGFFQQSLQFMDENGVRIRYEDFLEANKVRASCGGDQEGIACNDWTR
ncbi:MAG: hypothetical protein P8M36_01970 [Gammaproteobacteria bacterium]|nr:hypothetical protein [Gammaproteobacteria bacterium]